MNEPSTIPRTSSKRLESIKDPEIIRSRPIKNRTLQLKREWLRVFEDWARVGFW